MIKIYHNTCEVVIIENFSGINEEGIDKLVIDIYNSAESVHKIFDNISNLIEQTSDYYQTDNGDELRKKFNNFKINFDIINDKLLKYADGLASIKMKYQDLSFDVATNVKTNTDDISEEFK